MGTLYMRPEDFWIHAAPPSLLFGDADQGIQGIDEGIVTVPVRTTGTGSGRVTAGGIPRGAWTVLVRCTVGGEINDANTLNPSTTALPAFEFSRDGGTSWITSRPVSANRDAALIEVAKLGMRFIFENGSAPPSFVVNDVWTCHATPSADIIAAIPAVCAGMDKKLVGSFDLPLLAFPEDFTSNACDLLRWRLLKKIGVAERQDMQVYKPVEVWEWLKEAQGGAFTEKKTGTASQLGISEKAPGTHFPLFVPPLPDPLVPPI